MNLLRLAADGAVLSLLSSEKFKKPHCYAVGLIFMTLEVYFIYRGQENSDLFFWHGYLAWSIANMVFLITKLLGKDSAAMRRLLSERLALWQVVIVTVFAGFSLCIGWLMKLYIR